MAQTLALTAVYYIVFDTPEITQCIEPWSSCCFFRFGRLPGKEATDTSFSSRLVRANPRSAEHIPGGHEPRTRSRPQVSRSRGTAGGILERREKEPNVETPLTPAVLPRSGSKNLCPGPFALKLPLQPCFFAVGLRTAFKNLLSRLTYTSSNSSAGST